MVSEEAKPASRSSEQIRHHYLVERELAARLRNAPPEARGELYTKVYDELFQRVPDHPQLTRKFDQQTQQKESDERLTLLKKYLNADTTYLEIGPGDCSFAIEVAKRVRKVFAVDVSKEIAADVKLPGNVELVISNGSTIPVPGSSIDVAYSDQLMEHLHPDDAVAQLANIYRSLAPGGVYLCITPNRLSGPHDVSGYFEDIASGFHLKEYTAGELDRLFRAAGFRKTQFLMGAHSTHLVIPGAILGSIELLLQGIPRWLSRPLARGLPLRLVLGVKLIAWK